MCLHREDFPGGAVVKDRPADSGDAADLGLVPGWGRSPGGGNGNPLRHSAWRILWTEPGGLQSAGSQRVGHVQHHEKCCSILQQSHETLDNEHEPIGFEERTSERNTQSCKRQYEDSSVMLQRSSVLELPEPSSG